MLAALWGCTESFSLIIFNWEISRTTSRLTMPDCEKLVFWQVAYKYLQSLIEYINKLKINDS